MKNIRNDVMNKKLKRAYLIYGEEKYLVRNAKNYIINEMVEKGDNMNFSKFQGKECSATAVIDLAETLPFFSDYRIILLENTNWFKESSDVIANYIKEIPETTCIIFVESDVDKRNKVYKQVKANGYIYECNRATPKELSDWVVRGLSKEGKKITRDTLNYLMEKLGNDMDNISSEMEKLISYTGKEEVITKENIDNICTSEITGKIFEMIDAIGARNQNKALNLYYDLIAVREAPMKIMYMLSRQFNIMLQVKELTMNNVSSAEIASRMGMQSFIVNKTLGQCKNFKPATIKGALKYCMDLEESVKQGNMNDKMAVELVIVKYSKQ